MKTAVSTALVACLIVVLAVPLLAGKPAQKALAAQEETTDGPQPLDPIVFDLLQKVLKLEKRVDALHSPSHVDAQSALHEFGVQLRSLQKQVEFITDDMGELRSNCNCRQANVKQVAAKKRLADDPRYRRVVVPGAVVCNGRTCSRLPSTVEHWYNDARRGWMRWDGRAWQAAGRVPAK